MSVVALRAWRRTGGMMLAAMAAASLAGCATGPQLAPPSYLAKDIAPAASPSEPKETPDPLEAMNRKVFEGNQVFNHAIVYPVAKAYRDGLPEEVRDRVDAFFTNLSEPLVFANNVLQARPDAAMTTLARFVTNSTVGLGGLFDVARTVGQEHQTGDFGQTLYVWGVKESPYLVLPVLGPTNVRDAVGAGVEMVSPSHAIPLLPTKLGTFITNVNTVDTFGRPVAGLGKVEMMEELEASSLDFYAMLRSMADQKRQSDLQKAEEESLFYWKPPVAAAAAVAAATPSSGTTEIAKGATTKPSRTTVEVGIPKPVE